ncbi:hypothetical protein A3F66_06940 [candidate division TM6 bacterium RIFCSPHIGHO2_12_FULL_32_22]|nr:MAG: hypothetical protein A3F66_06940 [candidate division TM6 bacterium RIFCSPHIGHO2_12_FULL_32_22]
MKKYFVLLFLICKLNCTDRELTLEIDLENSKTHFHYVEIAWLDDNGERRELTTGPIHLDDKHVATRTIKNIPEEAVKNGLYITKIQARVKNEHSRSFYVFEANKNRNALKIDFPEIESLNPTYVICIGDCAKGQKFTLNNKYLNKTKSGTFYCVENCPGKHVS